MNNSKKKMSTFNGIVEEIPYIRVDRFDTFDENTCIFLLTHCHTDHTVGLSFDFFEMLQDKNLYLYASPISVRILKNEYPTFETRFKEVYVGESLLISADYNQRTVYLNIYAIPAGHCPGSLMFLFETAGKRILCTGDFRIDNLQQFMTKYFEIGSKINTVYLDTTFYKKQYPIFPSRKDTLNALCELIENWLAMHKNNIIDFDVPAKYGSEFLFIEIFKKTKYKIHVNNARYILHKFIPDMDGAVELDNTMRNLRIHACRSDPTCGIKNHPPEHICKIHITAMIWKDYQVGHSLVKCEGINYYRVCASYHPSYSETCDFIQYLKPDRIVPCVVPKDEDEKFEMFQLLKELRYGYSKKGEDSEKFFIEPDKLIKIEYKSVPKRKKDDLLSSPPRKFTKVKPSS